MPRRKSQSKEASETIAAGGFFMTILIAGVVLTLYLFTASPPWMDYIKSFFGSHFPQGGRTGSQTEGEVVRFMRWSACSMPVLPRSYGFSATRCASPWFPALSEGQDQACLLAPVPGCC